MDQASTLFLAVSIMIIMVGMGLGLTIQDFKRIADNSKPVLIGLFNQIVLLPLVGFGLCLVFKPEPFIAIGLMMLVACPGGTSSNIITLLAKGDLPLSISLTAINSLITIFTIPLIINFSFAYFNSEVGSIPPPAKDIFISLVAVIAIPLTIGMPIWSAPFGNTVRMLHKQWQASLAPPEQITSSALQCRGGSPTQPAPTVTSTMPSSWGYDCVVAGCIPDGIGLCCRVWEQPPCVPPSGG